MSESPESSDLAAELLARLLVDLDEAAQHVTANSAFGSGVREGLERAAAIVRDHRAAAVAIAQGLDAYRQRTTPHRYEPSGVATWRTCRTCGRGANATVHRQVTP